MPAEDVVPGDVLLLEGGDLVAADARLIEAHALLVNEAALTGESAPAEKRVDPAPPPDAPLAERHDQVFMGTAVARGVGTAVVTATGMATEIGRIAHLLAGTERSQTPLQARLATVGKMLLVACLAIVVVVAALGLARGEPALDVLLGACSLAVAAVPEGLPAMVTIALAIGVRRMAAQNVLVRRLSAVETLGCATVICSDKTGTLTTGIMTVRELWGPDHAALIDAAAACCDATLGASDDGKDSGGEGGVGDPTELAILVEARLRGIDRDAIEEARPRKVVWPFDSDTKRMSIFRADGILYMKGAVESVLACTPGGMSGPGAAEVLAANAAMAARGLRVLAVAVGSKAEESGVRVLGLVAMVDPPRSEVVAAIRAAKHAGIKTVMITGDQAATARAIALELGLLGPHEDGRDVVHARATPEDKLRIVRAWKAQGGVVAMTGDGVNDAPALREAHIGIAMGRTGTEVTRAASDMVLADDNFASIVAAVREGRGIFDNIRKALVYLLAGNASELVLMLTAGIAGWPVPLLPLHLLWVNLVTDGLPALALVLDPAPRDALEHPPRPANEPILGRAQWLTIGLIAAIEAGLVIAVYATALASGDVDRARAMALGTLVFCELFRAFAAHTDERVFFPKTLANGRLLAVIGLSVLCQLVISALPATRALFHLEHLTLGDGLVALALGLVPVTLIEFFRWTRASGRRRAAA
ncbi:MAG: cation-translocating P-type ATPase [Myxococcota bacterium]